MKNKVQLELSSLRSKITFLRVILIVEVAIIALLLWINFLMSNSPASPRIVPDGDSTNPRLVNNLDFEVSSLLLVNEVQTVYSTYSPDRSHFYLMVKAQGNWAHGYTVVAADRGFDWDISRNCSYVATQQFTDNGPQPMVIGLSTANDQAIEFGQIRGYFPAHFSFGENILMVIYSPKVEPRAEDTDWMIVGYTIGSWVETWRYHYSSPIFHYGWTVNDIPTIVTSAPITYAVNYGVETLEGGQIIRHTNSLPQLLHIPQVYEYTELADAGIEATQVRHCQLVR